MWKILPFLLLFAAPVKADITHKLTSSVQLNVNAAATNVERVGTSYSVSGNNVTTQYTPEGGSATNSIGSLTVTSGVGSIPTLSAVQATASESWSFTQSFTQGDALILLLQLQVLLVLFLIKPQLQQALQDHWQAQSIQVQQLH